MPLAYSARQQACQIQPIAPPPQRAVVVIQAEKEKGQKKEDATSSPSLAP